MYKTNIQGQEFRMSLAAENYRRWFGYGIVLLAGLLGGCGVPSFLVTPVGNTNQLEETVVEPGKGFSAKKIAVIEVEGMLVNAKSGGLLQPTENPLSLFTQRLDEAAKDSDVVAVVLRVNSPGGTVTTSDIMYQEVLRFRAKTHKPVIASTQEVTASGAYYLSCAADKIVAHPTSVIGSIGVVFYTFDLSGTMFKIGLRSEAIKSGAMKDIGSPFRAITPAERELMQGIVDEYFGRFKSIVLTNRPIKDPQIIQTITDGRVFSGQMAVKLGLADVNGTLTEAIEMAKDMAHAPDAKVVHYKRPYGYSGSIYAVDQAPAPQANTFQLNLPSSHELLPTGFYYLWEP